MMSAKTYISVAGVAVLAAGLAAAPASAAVSVKLSGAIAGLVTNNEGVPQMGATVMLFNRRDRMASKVMSDEKGRFVFAGLLPDVYSVRVTLASFVPAIRDHILVQPGMRSMLNVSLAALFSSIHLVYPSDDAAFMSDDWKWVLRTASSTRPVMRLLPGMAPDDKPRAPVFSDTRALVTFSAGDGSPVAGFGNSADMGTAFAVATSLFGSSQFQFAGNVGSGAQSGIPSAAFSTTYSRAVGPSSPEVSVTMRELFLPSRMDGTIFGAGSGVPMLRSMSAKVDDHAKIGDSLTLQYGTAIDSVTFNNRITYLSPYARLTYAMGKAGELEFDFTSGNAQPDLSSGESDDSLQRQIGSLGLFPLLSMRGGNAAVQWGQDIEMGYSRTAGSRKFSVRVYHESIRNLALTIASPNGFLPVGDILPDLFSGTSVFNAGNFYSMGYLASMTQDLGDHVSATVTYGSTGALQADGSQTATGNPDELRAMINSGRQQSLTMRVAAASHRSGTRIVASYQVADNRWAVPDPSYSTGSLLPQPGLNIYVRQAVPLFSGLPWRMELTADLRNLMQQGYLPLQAAEGQRVLLMEYPRMFRGGLSFIF